MENHSQAQVGGAVVERRAVRRRRRRGAGGRPHLVHCRLADAVFDQAEIRAARADLALAAWLVELGLDVALARPSLSAEQLDLLTGSWERLRRVGAVLNSVAKAENSGRAIPETQLAPTLDRVLAAAELADYALATVSPVFQAASRRPTLRPHAVTTPTSGWLGSGVPASPAAPALPSGSATAAPPIPTLASAVVGSRRVAVPGARRDRVVLTRLSSTERDMLLPAAEAAQVSLGAWLGLVAEAPAVQRPALLREQYRAVERLRGAARRLRTNLGQVVDARDARRAGELPVLTGSLRQVDDLLRNAFHVRGLVVAAGQSGL